MIPAHIDEAQRTAEAAGVGNLTLHTLDFAAAGALDLPKFNYIVAHGVYAWIDGPAAEAFRRFIDRHLAPGGLVYVSYNAMPGWALDAPFQHLVRALAAGLPGDSDARFAAAAGEVKTLAGAGPSALEASPLVKDWDAVLERLPRAYFAHEYLNEAWRPLYVDDFRAEMAQIGLAPVGSATLCENFDSFVLRRAAREALSAMPPGDKRELARDYFMAQRFRRDVLGRDVRRLGNVERRERLLATRVTLVKPPERTNFTLQTQAGKVDMDTPAARRLIAQLAGGPRVLEDCVDADHNAQTVLATALNLLCAGVLAPATRVDADVGRLNAALLAESGDTDDASLRVLPGGPVLRFEGSFLAKCLEASPEAGKAAQWAEFLGAMGAGGG
jgi:hypothetical protein